MVDISSLFSGAEQAAQNTVGQITAAGVPAVLSGIEQMGAQELQSLSKANTEAATNAAQNLINTPGPSSALGKAISSALGGVASGAVFKQYGAYIIIGVIALIVVVRRV